MQRVSIILILVGVLTLTMSCQNPLDRVDRTLQDTEERADRVVANTEERLQRLLDDAKTDIAEATDELKADYSESLHETSDEITKLREEFRRDLEGLDQRLEARIGQVQASASSLISETDRAAQARIDQLFTEMRLFVKETLAQVRDLIEPVLTLASTLNTAVGENNAKVQQLIAKILEIVDVVKTTFVEVQGTIRELTGKNPETGEDNPEGLAGLIAGILGTLMAAYTQWRRVSDHKRDGDRWKESEINDLVDKRVVERLLALGIISAKPAGGEKHESPS